MRQRTVVLFTAALAAVVTFASCSKKSETTGNESAPAESAAQAPAAALTDAQIAGIVIAANDVDVDGGKMAQTKAKNTQVKAFAKRMVTDHTAANKMVKALADSLHMSAEESDASRSIRSNGDQMKSQLQAMTGAAFDSSYIANEVTAHQNVLDAIENTLLPNAQNAELKALIQKIRPIVADHLDHAKKIQQALGAK